MSISTSGGGGMLKLEKERKNHKENVSGKRGKKRQKLVRFFLFVPPTLFLSQLLHVALATLLQIVSARTYSQRLDILKNFYASHPAQGRFSCQNFLEHLHVSHNTYWVEAKYLGSLTQYIILQSKRCRYLCIGLQLRCIHTRHIDNANAAANLEWQYSKYTKMCVIFLYNYTPNTCVLERSMGVHVCTCRVHSFAFLVIVVVVVFFFVGNIW